MPMNSRLLTINLLLLTVAFLGKNIAVFAFILPSSTTTAAASNSKFFATSTASETNANANSIQLVWLTGQGDLRTHDHGGFLDALEQASTSIADEFVVPIFCLDPDLHLRCQSTSSIQRLHNSLTDLEQQLDKLSMDIPNLSPLVVQTGEVSAVLSSLAESLGDTKISCCHVVADDVVSNMRRAQRTTCQALLESDIQVKRWDQTLRPTAPWDQANSNNHGLLPSFFPDYCAVADTLPVESPTKKELLLDKFKDATITKAAYNFNALPSEGVPSLEQLLQLANQVTPEAVQTARATISTTEPYDTVKTKWSTETAAQKALDEYISLGKDAFANRHFGVENADNTGTATTNTEKSLYASAAARLLVNNNNPSDVLATREAPTRAFSSALALGALSPRDLLDAARNRSPVTPPVLPFANTNRRSDKNNRAGLLPSDDPWLRRSDEGCLADTIEWREWYSLLAKRSLALQEAGQPGVTSGSEKQVTGDPRQAGTVQYWRWKGQHLTRYMTWSAGKEYEEERDGPAICLVHGFAASSEQWERLVYSLQQQRTGDRSPPIFALDLAGFGHSEKPGLSYTQYLWESQIVDFVLEIMEATPTILVGNSIGGGLSCGAAATLGDICQGLVLCNTAGVLVDPDEYNGYACSMQRYSSYTEAALEGNPNEAPYGPVPVVGNTFLDIFGRGIIQSIYPQIEKRLSLIYQGRMVNADPAVTYAIQQSAVGPGSANVVGSGQKLAPNRPLNEVLEGVKTLVVMGLNDQVSSPKVAQFRAELFSRLHPGTVTVETLEDAGHCPHDEVPDKVAAAITKWLKSFEETAAPAVKTQNEVEVEA